jgi:hypothetical protein
MIIIRFKDGSDWFKANWVFRQLASDVVATFPGDTALKSIMEEAEAVGALFLNSMQTEAAAATIGAIEKVAQETIDGQIPAK